MKKLFVVIIYCWFLVTVAYTQDQSLADSLKTRLQEIDNPFSQEHQEILWLLMHAVSEPDLVIEHANNLLEVLNENDKKRSIQAFHAIGVAYRMKGDLNQSLLFLLKSASVAKLNKLFDLRAQAYLEIGTTYTSNDDYPNALLYFNKAIAIFRDQGKMQELAINLLNTGYTYYEMDRYDTALLYYNEAEPIFDSLELAIGTAYTLGNRALVFWKKGQFETAEKDLLVAIEMLKPLGDQFGMADYHNQLGNLYRQQGFIEQSIDHLQRGLSMALELDLKEQVRDASLALALLHGENENYNEAYTYHRQYVAYRDSIQNEETTRRMADLRTQYEVDLREKEIDILERDKQLQWIYILVAGVFLALFIVLFLLYRQRLITQKLEVKAEREEHQQEVENILLGQEKKALESMIAGRENERKRLAGELHNHLGSLLATVKMNLNGVEKQDQRIETLHQLVDQAYTDVRELSHQLNMGVSDDFGLVPALKELISHLSQTASLKVELKAAMGEIQIDLSLEVIIYRIIQELVSNILKHAEATQMAILLTYFEDDELLNIMVTDNGKGFDLIASSGKSRGIGLSSLQEMVEKLGGDFELDSQPNQGTTISIDFPIVSSQNQLTP